MALTVSLAGSVLPGVVQFREVSQILGMAVENVANQISWGGTVQPTYTRTWTMRWEGLTKTERDGILTAYELLSDGTAAFIDIVGDEYPVYQSIAVPRIGVNGFNSLGSALWAVNLSLRESNA